MCVRSFLRKQWGWFVCVCVLFMSNVLLFIVYFAFSIPFVKDGELGVGDSEEKWDLKSIFGW